MGYYDYDQRIGFISLWVTVIYVLQTIISTLQLMNIFIINNKTAKMTINESRSRQLKKILQNFMLIFIVHALITNTMPIGMGVVRNISPSANLEQFLSAIAKPVLDENNKIQYTYNMVSLAGYDQNTKYYSLQQKLSPLMQWKRIYQMVLGSRPTVYGTGSSQIRKYIINQLFRPYGCRILMHVDLVNSPISGRSPVSSIQIGQEIVSALMELQLDGVSILFNDYNAVREGTASDWLQSLLRYIKSSIQNPKLVTVLIIPPIFVSKMKIFKLQQINSLIDYYILKYFDTLQADYTTYQSIFQRSSMYPQTSMFQLIKSGSLIDICRTLVAKPAINNGTWNNQQFVTQNNLDSAFSQAYSVMGWFGGYANLNMDTDKAGTFVKGVLTNLRDQCIRNENCYC